MEAWGDPVDTTEFLRDHPGYTSFYNSILGNATQIYDRDDGRFRPIYDSEIDLKILRAASWLLHAKVPMAQAWVNRLLDYTVGTGFDWTVEHESEAVQDFANRILDRTLTDNKWTSQLERETYRREIIDGETLSSLEWHSGSVEIDLRECDELTEPANGRQLEDYFDIEGPVSWTFGICTPRYRADKPIGYHCVRDQGGVDWDYIPVDRFVHWKRNVLGKAKRGVGDFYCPNVYLMRSDRVASNVGDSAAVQAAIAYIVEHAANTTSSQVSRGIAAVANAYPGRTDSINGSTEKLMRARVSRLDVRNGQKYHTGPMGQNNAPIYVEVMETLLRMAGTTHAFPEGMLTGSYANNNLASALVAESPFVQGRLSEQLERAAKIQELFNKILAMFANRGAFRKYGFSDWDSLKFTIKVHIHPSKVVPQDPWKLTQSLALQKANGWVSDKTAITELGRDYEVESNAMEDTPNSPSVPTLGQVLNGTDDKKPTSESATYGSCPQCGAEVIGRERRMNGNDRCANGHTFPSKDTIKNVNEPTLTPVQEALMESWKDYP